MVAWIVRALFLHSVEEYVLAIGGSNRIEYGVLIVLIILSRAVSSVGVMYRLYT